MSPAAIELYLAELAAAWPPDAGREAAISELRDHLLAMVEEAQAAGVREEQAIQAALAECGAATRLAANYRGNLSSQESRWIMRLSTAALAASILAVMGLATFWPGDQATPLLAVAQAQPGATPAAGSGSLTGSGRTTVITNSIEANNAATKTQLAQAIKAEFADMPMADVIAFISEKTGVETYINKRALADASIAVDSPVTVSLKNVRVDMLLDLVLQQVGADQIDYVIRDGIVVITDVASLDGASEVKAYPVTDLLKLHATDPKPSGVGGDPAFSPPGGAIPGTPGIGAPGVAGGALGGLGGGGPVVLPGNNSLPPNVQQLITVIQNTVSPDSWSEAGGHGTVTYYGEMLVIRQNARTHREIDKVLTMLRETAGKKVTPARGEN